MPAAHPYAMGQSQASLGISKWPSEGDVTPFWEDSAKGGMFLPMKKSMEMVGVPEFQSQIGTDVWDRNSVIHWMSGVRRKVRRSRYTPLSSSGCLDVIPISLSVVTEQKRLTWFLVGKEEKKVFRWCICRIKRKQRRLRNQNWREMGSRETVLGSFQCSGLVLTSAKFCLYLWGEGKGCYLMPFLKFPHMNQKCVSPLRSVMTQLANPIRQSHASPNIARQLYILEIVHWFELSLHPWQYGLSNFHVADFLIED